MKKLLANGSWQMENILYYLLVLFLPTQLGKHFWPDFAYVHGLRIDYLSPTVYLTDILILLIFILWFYRMLENRLRQRAKSKDKKLKINIRNQIYVKSFVGIFALLFLLFNITISRSPLNGIYYLWKLAEMSFLAYYTAKFISDKKQFNKTLLVLSLSSIVESALAILQFFEHGSLGGLLYFLGERTFSSSTPGIANASIRGELILRPYGTFPHPNVLAGYLVVVMVLILFAVKTEQNIKFKSLYASGLILGSVALFLTLSRVAILLWILIVGYFLYKLSFRAKSRSLIYFNFFGKRSLRPFHLVGMTVALILFGLLLTPLGSRFTSLNLADQAVVQREDLSKAAVKMIETGPLLGVGFGNFIPTLASFQTSLTVGTNLQPVHNIFLLVAAETGLIGLVFFIWFIFKIYQRLFYCHPELVSGSKEPACRQAGMPKLVRHDRPAGLIIAISSILVLGLFDHYWLTLQQGQLLFAIIIGLCWVSFKPSNKN